MKKGLLMALALVLMLAFCAAASAETSLEAFQEANANGTLIEKGLAVRQHVVRYGVAEDAYDREYDAYIRLVDGQPEYVTLFADGSSQFIQKGTAYGYNTDTKETYVCCFLEGAYEASIQPLVNANLGDFMVGQVITADTLLETGERYIVIEGIISESSINYPESCLGKTLTAHYVVDPDTLIIKRSEVFLKGEDGKEERHAASEVTLNPEWPVPDFDQKALLEPERTREIIILSGGQIKEVLTAPRDTVAWIYSAPGYNIYDTPDGQVFGHVAKDENGDYPAKKIYFSLPVEVAEMDVGTLEKANGMIALHDVYPQTAQHVVYYDYDTGEVAKDYVAHVIKNEDTGMHYIFVQDDGSVEAWGAGGGYGYIGLSGTPYLNACVGGFYEDCMLALGEQNLGEFEIGQVITDKALRTDGTMLVTVEGVVAPDSKSYAEYAGKTLVVRYELEMDTLVIRKSSMFIRAENGAERQIGYSTVALESDYQPPFDLALIQTPAATREVRVITDPKTDSAFETVIEAPLNMPVAIYAPEGYELYEDEDCTRVSLGVKQDEQGNYPAVTIVYAGK